METEEKKSHKLLNTFIFIIVLLVGIVFYSKYLGVKGLIVKEYKVESSILTKNFSGTKIVHFSDLLYKSTINNDDINELIERINILKPDIVIFSGDLINKDIELSEEDTNYLIESLNSINASIGKYAVYGDYDYSIDNYEDILKQSDFILLNNSYEEVYNKTDETIYIVGLPPSSKEEIDINSSFEFYNDEERIYTIVITHDGKTINYIDESNYEVDLILSGHSLNGSVVIPYYGGLFIDENCGNYYKEKYERGITNIFVSSGLGTNNYGYRFNNKPSFNLYRLKAQS